MCWELCGFGSAHIACILVIILSLLFLWRYVTKHRVWFFAMYSFACLMHAFTVLWFFCSFWSCARKAPKWGVTFSAFSIMSFDISARKRQLRRISTESEEVQIVSSSTHSWHRSKYTLGSTNGVQTETKKTLTLLCRVLAFNSCESMLPHFPTPVVIDKQCWLVYLLHFPPLLTSSSF